MCYFARSTANFLITRFEPDNLPKAKLIIRKTWSLRPDFHRLAKAATTSIATAPSARSARSLLVRFPLDQKRAAAQRQPFYGPGGNPAGGSAVFQATSAHKGPLDLCASARFARSLLVRFPLDQKRVAAQRQPFYGPGGNRTRVRKPLPRSISHHSHSFYIPSSGRRAASFRIQ